MYRILILLPLLFLPVARLTAQASLQSIDSLTWQLYSEGKWDRLVKVTEEALKNKTDFYYLRVRAGVAAWELRRYRLAVLHFREALKQAPLDEFVNSYYHSSLVMAGREDEANALADQLPEGLRERLQISKKGWVSSVSLEALLSGNSSYPSLTDENIDPGDSFSNYRSVLERMWYKNLGIDHHLSAGIDLFHSFNHIRIDRTEQFRSDVNLLDALQETFASQFQYFIQGRLTGRKGWQATLAYTRLWGESYTHYPEYLEAAVYRFHKQSYRIDDYLVNTGISGEFSYFRPRISFTTGRVNGFSQVQLNGQLVFYPRGNLNLYFHSEGSFHADGSSDPLKTVFTQKVGIKTGPVWVTGEAIWGTIRNFSSNDGLVVYNMPETIDGIYGVSFWVPLFRYRMNMTLRYLLSEKKGTTFEYTDTVNYRTKSYSFNDQSILISLKWNL